jgi:hypothetical protein
MKIDIIYKDDIIIVPETDFERQFLQKFEVEKVFHKSGSSASDYIGLKIERKKIKNKMKLEWR